MDRDLARSAGFALSWRAVQHIGVKLVYLARLLILARLLSPEDFGFLAVAMVSIDFLLHLTDFGMIPALVQRADAGKSHFNAAWTVGLVRATGVAILVMVGAPLIADIFAEPRATNIVRALALRPVLEASASIGIVRLTREFRFKTLAILWLIEALVNTVITISLAPLLGVWALVVGALTGPFVLSVLSYFAAPHRPRLHFDSEAIGTLIRFGRWIFITGLIGLLGRTVLQATISRELGVVDLGLYAFSVRLAFLPAEISSAVVGSVAFPLFSQLQFDVEKTAKAFRSLFTGLIVLLVPVVALMVVLAPSLVQEVLDEKWQGTAPIIGLLAVVSALGIFGDTAVPMFNGLGRPQRVTVLEALQTTILILSVWFFANRFGLVGAASAWLPAIVVSQIVCLAFVYAYSPKCLAGLGIPVLVVLAAATAGGGTAHLVDAAVGGLGGLILGGIGGLVVALGLILAGDRWLNLEMVQSLERVFPRVAGWLGGGRAAA